jgi:hypothetical protein
MIHPGFHATHPGFNWFYMIRFPEEMNGPGCFGTAILRILAGSGYMLRWSSTVALEAEVDNSSAPASQSGDAGNADSGKGVDGRRAEEAMEEGYAAQAYEYGLQESGSVGASEARASQSACGCIHGGNPNVLRSLAMKMNKCVHT